MTINTDKSLAEAIRQRVREFDGQYKDVDI
jgi:hypothetical protein